MNGDTHESSSSGACDHHIELLSAHYRQNEKKCKRDTEVHGGGYDPFTYCGRRVHVLLLTKIISIMELPLYISIIIFISVYGNATSVMFAVIILGWIGFSTIYGAFRGSKMCLIPFLILQFIFLVYDIILTGLLIMAVIFPDMFLSKLLRMPFEHLPYDLNHILIACSIILILLIAPLLWSTHIVYVDFLFISQIDETLQLIKETNQKISQDDVSPNRMIF